MLLKKVPECPLVAISGLFEVLRGASALPPKADIRIAIPHQPLTNVRFAPNSGHSRGHRWMSAFDPKRTFAVRVMRTGTSGDQ